MSADAPEGGQAGGGAPRNAGRGSGSWTPSASPRRFYAAARAAETPDGWRILLDDRPLKSPGKRPVAPPRPVAEAVAAEWAAQQDAIALETMPMTRLAYAATDLAGPKREALAADIAGYARSDLLCHRADRPAGLAARQTADWDPPLDWAAGRFGARLAPSVGVMPAAQDPAAIAALEAAVGACDAYALTALQQLTALSGSLILGLAALDGAWEPEAAWRAATLDETWQAEQWGEDAEAAQAAAAKRSAFDQAARLAALLRQDGS